MSIPTQLVEYVYEPGTTSIKKYTMTESSRVEVTAQARVKEIIVQTINSMPVTDIDGTSWDTFSPTEKGTIADSIVAEMILQGIIT